MKFIIFLALCGALFISETSSQEDLIVLPYVENEMDVVIEHDVDKEPEHGTCYFNGESFQQKCYSFCF